jgi:small-conductance mechanosensitive channel
MDEIKIPVQYGSNYELAKSIILEVAEAVELSVQSKEKWKTLQSKYRLEDAQTEPMFLIANDNWLSIR